MLNRQFLLLISFSVIFGLLSGIGVRLLEKSYLSAGIGYTPTTAVISRITETDTNLTSEEVGEKTKEPPVEVTLIFVGDIMLDRGVKKKIETVGGGDFRFPFLKIVNVFKEADIVAGNLEGPLSDKGKEAGNLYSFRMPPQALEGLKFAGFDALSLANNHIGDWGLEALKDTIFNLENAGIVAIGAGRNQEETYTAKIIELKNLKFAFLAFADFEDQYKNTDVENNVAVADPLKISASIKDAKEKADIVIVYYHFGDEYAKEPSPRQKFLAELAIDEGADLVVGSHPHVIQPLETYKDKYIAYGLGNFVFDQNFSKETMTGGLLRVVLRDKSIVSVDLNELQINEHFQPVVE